MNNFAFGKYTAILSLEAGTKSSVTDTAEVGFWVLPWRVILVWGLGIVLGVFIIIWLFKRYNAWIIKKARK